MSPSILVCSPSCLGTETGSSLWLSNVNAGEDLRAIIVDRFSEPPGVAFDRGLCGSPIFLGEDLKSPILCTADRKVDFNDNGVIRRGCNSR
ncbi:hypothetical protein CBR_g10929 [Chara braunii]|uniref:Uncharacterized protein n=1 Tax=Chara braunii TaxID=69332 RepID=A0A388KPJ6_CHABU|nr:hypothetical protein CBR_g10929 [Chara braunii]|eukprot:GBG71990.1 hypothetical protein CBR_g10929 [Chara braunii]